MTQFLYDVAISFAGENRAIAADLAGKLQGRGVKVFYDEYDKATLWGKNLVDELAEIYERRARFCVMIISHAYARKKWTSHERKSAQARALAQQQEYILPVRLDDTEVPGLPSTIAYIDSREVSIDEIADLVAKKLGRGQIVAVNRDRAYLESLPHDLPVRFGMHRIRVHETLGKPDIVGKPREGPDDFETHNPYGICISYIADTVVKIEAATLAAGTTFFGLVYGCRIGDTLDRCAELWGPWLSNEPGLFDYNIVKWVIGDVSLTLEVWQHDGLEPLFGSYKAGRIKQIGVAVLTGA